VSRLYRVHLLTLTVRGCRISHFLMEEAPLRAPALTLTPGHRGYLANPLGVRFVGVVSFPISSP
jgi:hypothetical protein